MADRWFQIREAGTGTDDDPYRPEHVEEMGLSFSGNKTAPSGAPWVVRVYGTADELDTLAAQAGVNELSNVPTTALNQMLDVSRTADQWRGAIACRSPDIP